MTFLRKISAVILAVLIFASFSVISFAESGEKSLSEIYSDPYGRTLCAARKGYWRNSAENSLRAIKDAVEAGADIVEIDIRKTSDGVLILMADETTKRMCGEDKKVSELTFDEISEFYLLGGEGGPLAEKTEQKVPSLEQVFENKENCLYLLDADWALRDEIYALALKYGMTDSVIFLARNVKPSEVEEWKSSLGADILIMTYFKGNIIFNALSYVGNSAQAGAQSVYLATKVPYGVVFGETVTGKADGKIRMMVNTAESELCGKLREDTEVWWDDLISRGYSIILTDYVPELKEYIGRCEEKREVLSSVYEKLVTNWQLPDLKSDKYLDYKLAYNNAVALSESLLKDGSSSRSDLGTAIYELQKAYDDINNDYDGLKDGSAGMTVTPVRILLCVVAVIVVTIAEIFVYKKKKKS